MQKVFKKIPGKVKRVIGKVKKNNLATFVMAKEAIMRKNVGRRMYKV